MSPSRWLQTAVQLPIRGVSIDPKWDLAAARYVSTDPATFDEEENVEDRIIMGNSFWDMNGHGKSGGMKLDRESWQVPLIADLPV